MQSMTILLGVTKINDATDTTRLFQKHAEAHEDKKDFSTSQGKFLAL